ncbi:histidinol-phosphate transaminase [Thermoanaerobacterium thermosaccharolyticum]|uniref:histidinol-phosphate transaminase n=1 Tax=Thermoanaerobacterium thermosaccharolyticum TaxID=1517 RepID=UPI001045568E|nr:histidinol-phosphate transaminase [Thermoanaerobacterium thermosaccharolyticum]KAA5808518.1 histidinol-phosphate transaminase [Thermoanaerobacterium thermosaccharolyticum]TCW38103.1 histidinol-phosphate aminotransferase [Thermohydrogenium kirishiense]
MIYDLLRDEIKGFKNYEVSNIECKYKMDANEVPFSLPESTLENLQEIVKSANVNRYPDPVSIKLRDKLAEKCSASKDNILVGNGSDEIIHIIMNAFVSPDDFVVYPVPSFSMYRVYSEIAGANKVEVSLGEDYHYDVVEFIKSIKEYDPKLVILCNPNNPTGTTISRDDIIKILEVNRGITVVDEAYYEFFGETVIDLINKYKNMIVLRTLSKAYGLAGLRVGYAVSNPEMIGCLNLVKSPYNVNSISQAIALSVLEADTVKDRVEYIKNERKFLMDGLSKIDGLKVYNSQANFLLLKFDDADYVYNKLLEKGILVRDFSGDNELSGTLRVTIGTREANSYFIKCIKEILS